MTIRVFHAWSTGFLLIVLFVLIGEIIITLDDYVYSRIGIDRNIILVTLWILPFCAAFFGTYQAQKYKLLVGLSYILILPLLAAVAHMVNGMLGASIDLRGFRGALVIFQINFFIGGIVLTLGSIFGIQCSKNKAKGAIDGARDRLPTCNEEYD